MNNVNHWLALLQPTDMRQNLASLKQTTIRRGCMSSKYANKDDYGEPVLSKKAIIRALYDRGDDIESITKSVGSSWRYVVIVLNNEGIRIRDRHKYSTKRRPVDQLALDGSHIATFPSMSKAGKALEIAVASICNVCHGSQKTAGGYRFRFHDAASKKAIPNNNNKEQTNA
ncbi:MAG TPA: hypothetical protein PKD44_08635 [Nitrosomonas sp.]|nr:hypothetical protein [Nitrosomonas sp.]